MQGGWWCRSMANMQAEGQSDNNRRSSQTEEQLPDNDYTSDDSSQSIPEQIDYKTQYCSLKKKLKFLIYENECFQDALRSSQKKLLKSCRDRSFLLDRLLQYEKPEVTSSDSDETDSSEDLELNRADSSKKKKIEPTHVVQGSSSNYSTSNRNHSAAKRRRPPPQKKPNQNNIQHNPTINKKNLNVVSDGHMTPEEVERHLQSRQNYTELVPERAPPTVPTEMFSNDPSLDSESNDNVIIETSCNIVDDWIE